MGEKLGLVIVATLTIGAAAASIFLFPSKDPPILSSTARTASTTPMIGYPAEMTEMFPGCLSKEVAEKIRRLVVQKDPEAAEKLSIREACHVLVKGDRGMVEDSAAFSRLICLRQASNPDCYWVPIELAERREQSKTDGAGGKN